MELKVFETPGQEWDEFASRYTDLIFYQSIWSEVLKKGLGGQPLYFYLEEGNQIVAGLPAVLLNFKFFKVLYASIPYGGFIGEENYFPAFLEILDKEFQKRGIDQVRITESPFLESHVPNTFVPLIAKCTLLNLQHLTKGGVRESYRSEVRRAVRKAEKCGLMIKKAESKEEIKTFYRLYLAAMERNQAPVKYPLEWFNQLYGILIKRGKADCIFARKPSGEYIAGVFLIYSPTSLHYLHNGSEEASLESRPNDFIVDHIIDLGVNEGKAFLDFMGSDPQDFTLRRFKEKWGGQSKDIYTYVKNYNFFRCKVWEAGKKLVATGWGSKLVRTFRR